MPIIPIKNLYYLLSYAWNHLEGNDFGKVSIDDQTKLADLFASILINGVNKLFKRGFEKYYVNQKALIPAIKGKLEISDTLKKNSHRHLKTVCSYDEYSIDVKNNQILFATLKKLMKVKDLSHELKKQLRSLVLVFPNVTAIELADSNFKNIKFNRNNKTYRFLIHICQIIFESILPSETLGKFEFLDFTRDERKMAKVFEYFIFNFYDKELSNKDVRRRNIKWKFEAENPKDLTFLPVMKTDITIESALERIIIDAKYYKETMQKNYDKDKIHPGNIFQLFSYLKNQESDDPVTQTARGVLIYPTINNEYDLSYTFDQHTFQIKTLDLAAPWKNIAKRLLDIV